MITRPQLAIHLKNWARDESEGWQPMLDRARAADAAGVDRVLVSEHVVFGEHLEAYASPELGGVEGGLQPTGPDGSWLDPLVVLAVVSAMTTRVRLGTSILLAALRRPVTLAKTLATLDVLSNGRLDVGVGVGWQREEYEAAGLAFEHRGASLDQTLAVCRALWAPGPASFDDGDLVFDAIHCVPKPVQPGGIPIWVSGRLNGNVLARIVQFGSGWVPWGDDALDPRPGLARLREALARAGRDSRELRVLRTLRVTTNSNGRLEVVALADELGRSFDAGVTDFRVDCSLPSAVDAATETLSELVGVFRAAGR